MNKSDQLEHILKLALTPEAEPSEALHEKIKKELEESRTMKPIGNKRIAIALVAVISTLLISVTTLAAWQFLSPKQVAEQIGNQKLADAFEDKGAIEINKSVTSCGYTFTLLGITSGENLSSFKSSAQNLQPDRTYAVISVVMQDGSPMPAVSDEKYGQNPFIVSPLIKGQKPWQVNIFTMSGGYSECVVDGAMYRMIECDNVEMFADRGVYLYAGAGTFIDNKTVDYNEKTGEISLKKDSKTACALYDLPLDVKKADPVKAEKYLNELLNPQTDANKETSPTKAGSTNTGTVGENSLDSGKQSDDMVIPDSVKKVTYDEEGMVCYAYEGNSSKIASKSNPDYLFKEGETGVWIGNSGFGLDGEVVELQFYKDKTGEITGRLVKTGQALQPYLQSDK